jgi:hypothetical protein
MVKSLPHIIYLFTLASGAGSFLFLRPFEVMELLTFSNLHALEFRLKIKCGKA